MNEPKRHHYVPRSYLEFFSQDNGIWVYDKKEKKYFNPSLENVTVIQHYYSIISDDDQKDNSIEKYFAKLEGKAKPILEKLDQCKQIDQQERYTLALFIAYQFTRVPSYEKQNRDSVDWLFQTMKEWDIPDEEPTEIKVPDFLPSDTPGVSVRGLHNYLTELKESDKKFKNQHLQMMISSAKTLVDAFVSLDWTFVYAGEGSSFITSSNPFAFTFRNYKEKPRVIGVIVKDVIKLFPISSRVCLMMGDIGTSIGSIEASAKSVEEFNLVSVDNSDRYILHRDKSLLETLLRKAPY
jgi:hypothetical protein